MLVVCRAEELSMLSLMCSGDICALVKSLHTFITAKERRSRVLHVCKSRRLLPSDQPIRCDAMLVKLRARESSMRIVCALCGVGGRGGSAVLRSQVLR